MNKTLLFLILGLTLPILSKAQIPSYIPSNGLQGWWPFGGDANDYSGNNHHGIVNGPLLTTDRFGSNNCAYSFNGISDFISTSYTGILGDNARAVSFWAKTTNTNSSMAAVNWGDSQNYPNSGKKFGCGFNVFSSGVTIDGADCALTYYSANYADNQWHHYVFQMDSAALLNQIKIYMDGNLLNTISSNFRGSSGMSTINYFNVHFGKLIHPSLTYYYQGSLDDVAIWNRTLTIPEIMSIYGGSSSCGAVTGINELLSNVSFYELNPNPANQNLIIKCNSESLTNKQTCISIFSNDGKLVKKENLQTNSNQIEQTINIEDLARGFYHINISNGQYSQNLKFIKD